MIFDSSTQIFVFASCVFIGSCVFLIYKFTHLIATKNKIVLAIADIAFCIVACCVLWGGLLFINCGEIRWFCLLGIVLGFLLCKSLVSQCIDIFVAGLYNFLRKKLKKKENKNTDGQI